MFFPLTGFVCLTALVTFGGSGRITARRDRVALPIYLPGQVSGLDFGGKSNVAVRRHVYSTLVQHTRCTGRCKLQIKEDL